MFSDPNIFGLQFSAAKDEFIEDVTSVVSGKKKKKKKKKKKTLFVFPLVYVLLIFIAQILVNSNQQGISALVLTTQTFNGHNHHLNLLPQVLHCCVCRQYLFFLF